MPKLGSKCAIRICPQCGIDIRTDVVYRAIDEAFPGGAPFSLKDAARATGRDYSTVRLELIRMLAHGSAQLVSPPSRRHGTSALYRLEAR